MSSNWLANIKHVVAGEPVQASVVNRPGQALEDRTNYLKDRLDASDAGRAIFDVDATIATDVAEGEAVFWNAGNQRYERALAAVVNNELTQTLLVAPSSECIGLLHKKKGPTLGDVVLHGIVKIKNLAQAIVSGAGNANSPIEAGRYFLSATQPGKLVKQKPSMSVAVCYVMGAKDSCDSDPWVVVMPQVRDFFEDHVHYRFELVPEVAGCGVIQNGKYIINQPNTALKGWLNADNPIFRTTASDPTTAFAPVGAAFGYNLSAQAELQNLWPPIPLQAVSVLWDKGQDLVGATEAPLGSDGLVICDAKGIWWMSSCLGDVPFPIPACTPIPSSSSSSTPPPPPPTPPPQPTPA